jgi:hypothetical protein
VPAEEPLVPEEMLPEAAEADLVPAEAPQVPEDMLSEAAEADLVPAEAPQVPEEMLSETTEADLVPAEAPLVPEEMPPETAEADLVKVEVPLVPKEMLPEIAEVDLVPAEVPLVPAEMLLEAAEAGLVPAEAQLEAAEAPLVSTRIRPADTACKRAPLAAMEDLGPVLPSEWEAGETTVYAESTRPVESADAFTSPRSHAGIPAAAGEGPRKPQGAAPSPPRKRCNVAGEGGWEYWLSRRILGLKYEEFRKLLPAARLNLVR